ncbi:porin [Shewanella pneumatophori]|uniref:Porin n=1 Tax=Shewanella pneumatophori TaxID=314092 RepID=A0A9X1ZFI6_9GAMM|nr:porin [Shewanella pneumatophori]MCL1140606.1 porin [Shewanella pneumatophori]
MLFRRIAAFALPMLLLSPAMAAIELTDNINLSGFGSTAISKTDNRTPLFISREITDEACYDCDTAFGLQLDVDIFDGFAASGQVVKRTQDKWSDPELEWAYLSYEYNEFEIRAGRLRLPLFLASEYYYVGQAYPWARPPQEVYDSILGFTSYDGLSLAWNYELTDGLQLTVSPYYGFERLNEVDLGNLKLEFDTEYMAGMYVDLVGFNYRVHSGYMQVKYTQRPFPITEKLDIYTLGAEYSFESWLWMAEVEVDRIQANWYASMIYAFDDFSPYLTYAESHQSRKSKGVTAGVRYDATSTISLNLEYQMIFSSEEGNRGQFITSPLEYSESSDVDLVTLSINFVF